MADEKPIIVVKKKGHHGGHHGGAWKVAYADFVTAMMAFFMVMWLVNTADTTTKKAIAVYFRRPGIFEQGSGAPLMLGQSGIMHEGMIIKDLTARQAGEPGNAITPIPEITRGAVDQMFIVRGTAEDDPGTQDETKQILELVSKEIATGLGLSPELRALLGEIDVAVEPDGIKIEIVDTDKVSMFASGSPRISKNAEPAFAKVADLVRPIPLPLDIVGHTDGKPFSNQYNNYSNWELSADRANAARRLLEQNGVEPGRISRVLGMADRELKVPDDPLAAANRRITLKLRLPKDPAALEELVKRGILAAPTPIPEPSASPEPSPSPLAEMTPLANPPFPTPIPGAENRLSTGERPQIAPKARDKEAAPWHMFLRPPETPVAEITKDPRETIFSDMPIVGPPGFFE